MAGGHVSYADFLERKIRQTDGIGIDVDPVDLNQWMHPWQREIVAWAARRGRAAIWADTGLGKTAMQVEWLRLVTQDGIGLIVAPLAVCQQTIREARDHLGVTATYVREMPTAPGIYVTNYEMVDRFDADMIRAVVLDESSILKQSDGKTRTMLIKHFADVPFRLACTATPAPNDPEELTNHAEFLGVSTRTEMLAAYFVHDQDGWRLKGHARRPMFRWMASWAVALRRPSDMGYDDAGYVLPELHIHTHLIDVNVVPDGQLFATDIGGVGGRAAVRKSTIEDRCQHAAELIKREPDEPWIVWCGLNAEAEMMAELLPGSVNVHGGWTPEDKAQAMLDFADGKIRTLITKPSIASFGLNWQHCARMAFVGLSDSYESYYQSIRRCYRYGQTREVEAHIILTALEQQIASNVNRKQLAAADMTAELVRALNEQKENA
jgi:hypothetical protein